MKVVFLFQKLKIIAKRDFFNQKLIAREAKQLSLNNLGNMTYYRFKFRTAAEINDWENYVGEHSHDWRCARIYAKHVLVWL